MRIAGLIILLVALIVLSSAAYQVRETEQVIITQFGKPIGQAVSEPGLHFKLPLVQRVNRFDRRFLEWDGDANELPTKEKRLIWVDTYARWRISDPLLFFQRLRDEAGAQSRLDDILDSATRKAIANHNLAELVRSTNREPLVDESELAEEDQGTLAPINYGRERIRQEVLTESQAGVQDLGIEVLDVQFKRINYVDSVRQEVYQRMIAERQRIAARFRSQGQGEAARIRGDLERDLKKIQSEAYRQAEEIRGRADAQATEIYASAYDQSADSRSFYQFLKTMETLQSTVDEETTFLLSTDGEFYRFLEDSGGR
jgi:membrane protease subunit HflC